MFYETAHTVGPGWHQRSYKPSQYEDMSWSPSSRHFRSPGSSPETYRRINRNEGENDFPKEDEFFDEKHRRSPTFPRRIFKEVWNDDANHRFPDRPRLFKRVFKPSRWDDEEDTADSPHFRRMEKEFDEERPKKFDDDFQRRMFNDMSDDFGRKAEGKVHHIPIMVEKRMEDLKSHFGKKIPDNNASEMSQEEEWMGPQVQRLRKNFEQEDGFYPQNNRFDRGLARPRAFGNTIITDTWDPHAVHTLPTRKSHKASQSFDDCRHPVSPTKQVFRSYSETHDEMAKPHQSSHSAAFRSHSDGHCPNQTYITKIEVQPPDKTSHGNSDSQINSKNHQKRECDVNGYSQCDENIVRKSKSRSKFDSPSLQQIAVVLQNMEDLVTRVESYSGTGRDKQYRFIDEMLTRCMLRLDDVDTEGREDVRNARKAALIEVQNCIDLLEAKANESERRQNKVKDQNTEEPEQIITQTESQATPLREMPSPNQAIPLSDSPPKSQAIPLVDSPTVNQQIPLCNLPSSKSPIPLGDPQMVKEAIPLGDSQTNTSNQAIPLADVPMSNMAIPLGYVPSQSNIEQKWQNSIEQTKL